MKELSRFEMAVVKRTAKNTKSLRVRRDKLEALIKESQNTLERINKVIEEFEAPIKSMTGGYTSEEVLSGVMEVSEATEAKPEGEVSEETVEQVEVAAAEAVNIHEMFLKATNLNLKK